MFSSKFWLGVIVGVIVMFALMFVLDVDASAIREKLNDAFGGSSEKQSGIFTDEKTFAALGEISGAFEQSRPCDAI